MLFTFFGNTLESKQSGEFESDFSLGLFIQPEQFFDEIDFF